MIVWILAATSLAPSPFSAEPPTTEASPAVETEAVASTYVWDGGDDFFRSDQQPQEGAAAEVSL
jgi:hypothetical protein